jgi:GNAT superfamily N-acetyltransferase
MKSISGSGYEAILRPNHADDEPAIKQLGALVAGWRNALELRLVAGEPAMAHPQIVDRGTTASRREGVCDLYLRVAPEQRGRGIATALKVHAIAAYKARDATAIEPENHSANAQMLAIIIANAIRIIIPQPSSPSHGPAWGSA